MKFIVVLLCTTLTTNFVYSASPRVDPLVKINQGLVRGHIATDGLYSYFLGIPYAQLDLNNPFGPAQPPKVFEEEIFDAYEGSIQCPQWHTSPFALRARSDLETLDCLRLNIYVPNDASSRNPLPVLVWIHGGVFSAGYAGMFNPRELVKQGIVVVTINYRLGPYGFLCLDSPLVPGNQGLKDQYEALRWIRNNIAAFGGNPYKVTISGQSAGSCSSLLHLYSEKEKLFNQVIAQSGTPQNEGMFVEGDYDAAIKLAMHLGLNTTDTEEALGFLANISSNVIIEALQNVNLVLRPCKEKSFSGVENYISDYPNRLSNENKVKNTPVMIGHTSMEEGGALFTYVDFSTDPFYVKLEDNFNLNENEQKELANIVRHFYVGDKPISQDLILELERFESDFIFNHPTRRIITNLLKENASPVFEYFFSYKEDKNASGAHHSSELKYLFNSDDSPKSETEESQLLSNRMTTLWSNFVKYGNPTPEKTELLPVIWEPSNAYSRPYLVIDTDMRLEHRVYKDRMSFWDLFYSTYGEKQKLSLRTSC